jgi:hypothetical protein
MRYITTSLVAATLLATTSVYAQQAASPAPQQSGTTTSNSTATSDQDQVSRRLVRQIQARLKQQGYLDKAPDGVWDNDTAEALADYQDSNGLPSTGQLDGMTIFILGIATPPNGGASAMQPGPANGGAMTQSAAQQPQQQPHVGGADLHQVLVDTYEQGYQQGLMQGYRQSQSAMVPQAGASQGGSQTISGTPARTKQ